MAQVIWNCLSKTKVPWHEYENRDFDLQFLSVLLRKGWSEKQWNTVFIVLAPNMGLAELLFHSFQTGQSFLGLLMSLSDIFLTGLPFFLVKRNLAKIANIFGTKGRKEIETEILSAQKRKKTCTTCQSARIAKVKKVGFTFWFIS